MLLVVNQNTKYCVQVMYGEGGEDGNIHHILRRFLTFWGPASLGLREGFNMLEVFLEPKLDATILIQRSYQNEF